MPAMKAEPKADQRSRERVLSVLEAVASILGSADSESQNADLSLGAHCYSGITNLLDSSDFMEVLVGVQHRVRGEVVSVAAAVIEEEDFAFCHTISNEFYPQKMASLWMGSIIPLANLAILLAADYFVATGGNSRAFQFFFSDQTGFGKGTFLGVLNIIFKSIFENYITNIWVMFK